MNTSSKCAPNDGNAFPMSDSRLVFFLFFFLHILSTYKTFFEEKNTLDLIVKIINFFFFFFIYISLFPHLKIVLGTWCRVNGVWKPLTKTFTYRQHHTGCLIVVFTNHIYNTPHLKIFEITETSFFF